MGKEHKFCFGDEVFRKKTLVSDLLGGKLIDCCPYEILEIKISRDGDVCYVVIANEKYEVMENELCSRHEIPSFINYVTELLVTRADFMKSILSGEVTPKYISGCCSKNVLAFPGFPEKTMEISINNIDFASLS